MSIDESERLARIATVAVKARETFGDTSVALKWLCRPNRALAEHTPLSLLDTDGGAAQVETVLCRLEHGLIS